MSSVKKLLWSSAIKLKKLLKMMFGTFGTFTKQNLLYFLQR